LRLSFSRRGADNVENCTEFAALALGAAPASTAIGPSGSIASESTLGSVTSASNGVNSTIVVKPASAVGAAEGAADAPDGAAFAALEDAAAVATGSCSAEQVTGVTGVPLLVVVCVVTLEGVAAWVESPAAAEAVVAQEVSATVVFPPEAFSQLPAEPAAAAALAAGQPAGAVPVGAPLSASLALSS